MSSQENPLPQAAEQDLQVDTETVNIPERTAANERDPDEPGTGNTSVSTPRIKDYSIFQRHMIYDPIMIIFTILIFAGGATGYFTKQSIISLVSGTIFAFLLAAGTFIEGTQKKPYLLMFVLLALGVTMTDRYRRGWVFMPSGLIATLSFLMLARHAYIFYLRRKDATV